MLPPARCLPSLLIHPEAAENSGFYFVCTVDGPPRPSHQKPANRPIVHWRADQIHRSVTPQEAHSAAKSGLMLSSDTTVCTSFRPHTV